MVCAACFERSEPKPATSPRTELVPIGFAEWKARRASYRPQIVVVDLWATWCAPCIENFPKMIEMSRRFGPQGVRFVSISFDDANDPDSVSAAEDFLQEVQATFDNFLLTDSMRASFENFDAIGLPVVLMYDGEGKERVRLSGDDPDNQFDDKDVETALLGLLQEIRR